MRTVALLVLAAPLLVVSPLTDGFGLDAATPGCGLRELLLFGLGLALAWGALRPPPRRAAIGASAVLVLIVFLGVVLGWVDVVHQTLRGHSWGVIVRRPDLVAWMAPAIDLCCYGALGAGWALLTRWRPAAGSLRTVVFVAVLIAVWSQLFAHAELHDGAVLLLSTGLATAAARLASRLGAAAPRWAARLLLPALLVLAGTSTWLAGGCPPATAPSPVTGVGPNVLLVVLDTTRADHVGCYGYHRDTTPNLDALAETGVVCEQAIATAPFTLTSHASMFTGHYPVELFTERNQPLDDRWPTLAEVFAHNGYDCGGFIGNVPYCSRAWGLARGFQHYDDYAFEPRCILLASPLGLGIATAVAPKEIGQLWRNDCAWVHEHFLAWLDERDRGQGSAVRPWFAFLNDFDAHGLYLPPAPWAGRYGPEDDCVRELYQREQFSAHERQALIDAYDACLRWQDDRLGELLAALRERGVLEHTLVVVVGDHGEQFGEHGLYEHANSLYLPLLHVPLIFHGPGAEVPARVPTVVSLADLPATILDLAGIPSDHPLPGCSLAPLWQNPKLPFQPSLALSNLDDETAVLFDGKHAIVGKERASVFDLERDPREEQDVGASAQGRAFLERVQGLVEQTVRARGAAGR